MEIFRMYKVSPQLFLIAPDALKNVHFSMVSGCKNNSRKYEKRCKKGLTWCMHYAILYIERRAREINMTYKEQKMKKTSSYNPDADKKWAEKNRDHRNFLSKRSTARSFIRNDADKEDLEELKDMIEERVEKETVYIVTSYRENARVQDEWVKYEGFDREKAIEIYKDEKRRTSRQDPDLVYEIRVMNPEYNLDESAYNYEILEVLEKNMILKV